MAMENPAEARRFRDAAFPPLKENPMKVLVIGATGPTGRELISQGIALGHEMTAAVRHPESAGLPAGAKVVRADAMDMDSLKSAVSGQQAVVSSLGTKLSRKPTTLLSDGTRNLVAAMRAAAVRRLVCITGIGAGDSRGHGGFLYDRIIQPLLLNEIYKDKTRQEAVVRESGLDWTLVRPAALTNSARTGRVKAYTNLDGITVGKISRADVAAFILSELENEKSVRSTFTITA
jgi:putative NADH-flavin reductase